MAISRTSVLLFYLNILLPTIDRFIISGEAFDVIKKLSETEAVDALRVSLFTCRLMLNSICVCMHIWIFVWFFLTD